MAPVFFEMSDLYDEGKLTSVPEAMDFLVNGIFAVAGRPIYHHAYIKGECYEIIPKSCGFTWLYEAALPYVEAILLSDDAVSGHQVLQRPGRASSARPARLSLRDSLRRSLSGGERGHSTNAAYAGHGALFTRLFARRLCPTQSR